MNITFWYRFINYKIKIENIRITRIGGQKWTLKNWARSIWAKNLT